MDIYINIVSRTSTMTITYRHNYAGLYKHNCTDISIEEGDAIVSVIKSRRFHKSLERTLFVKGTLGQDKVQLLWYQPSLDGILNINDCKGSVSLTPVQAEDAANQLTDTLLSTPSTPNFTLDLKAASPVPFRSPVTFTIVNFEDAAKVVTALMHASVDALVMEKFTPCAERIAQTIKDLNSSPGMTAEYAEKHAKQLAACYYNNFNGGGDGTPMQLLTRKLHVHLQDKNLPTEWLTHLDRGDRHIKAALCNNLISCIPKILPE